MYTSNVSTIVFRQLNLNYTHRNVTLRTFFNHSRPEETFRGYRQRISLWLREQSMKVADTCIKQFEFITARRIRRSIRIFHIYTRIWDEILLKNLKTSCKQKVTKNAKQFMISAVGVTMYDWDRERIGDKEFYRYGKEIDAIHKLKNTTVVCPQCHLRLIFDKIQPNIKYCECNDVKPADAENQKYDWEPFIEREDMLIWRKQEQSNGLYAYKIYGSFPEITAEDFLQIQIDIDYRKEWDSTAQSLEILETDPKSMSSKSHSTDVIYWETKWPRLFANRDYVYQRRWMIDGETGVVIIINRETEHPNAPNKPDIYRVTSYWSYMVIKPYTNFHEPGIEFGLTYFDDSGVDVPLAISSWIAMSGIPEFMNQMRQATKDYKKYKTLKEETNLKDGDIWTKPDELILNKVDSEDTTVESVRLKTEEKISGEKKEDTVKSTPETDKTVSSYSFFDKLFA